jgi:hypothetical protein
MSGPAYALRMILLTAMAIVLMFVASAPLAALHPHWDNDACEAFQALSGMLFCGGCVTFVVLLSLLPTAISVLIAVWIYYDARKRNDPNAVPWALLGFLLNVIGWIAYLIAREQHPAPAAAPPAAPPGPPPPDTPPAAVPPDFPPPRL